jgi:hypothetical protein
VRGPLEPHDQHGPGAGPKPLGVVVAGAPAGQAVGEHVSRYMCARRHPHLFGLAPER